MLSFIVIILLALNLDISAAVPASNVSRAASALIIFPDEHPRHLTSTVAILEPRHAVARTSSPVNHNNNVTNTRQTAMAANKQHRVRQSQDTSHQPRVSTLLPRPSGNVRQERQNDASNHNNNKHSATNIVFPTTTTTEQSVATNVRINKSSSTCQYVDSDIDDRQKGGRLISTSFCEEADDYPDELIRQALAKKSPEFKELFNNIDHSVGLSERKFYHDDSNVHVNEYEGQAVCTSVSRTIYPKKARNRENKWMYIANNADFTQVVEADICLYNQQPCRYLRDTGLPPGMVSRCHQKFSTRTLLAMDPGEERLTRGLFQFPTCCVCSVYPSFDSRSLLSSDASGNGSSPLTSTIRSLSSESNLMFLDDTTENMSTTPSEQHRRIPITNGQHTSTTVTIPISMSHTQNISRKPNG